MLNKLTEDEIDQRIIAIGKALMSLTSLGIFLPYGKLVKAIGWWDGRERYPYAEMQHAIVRIEEKLMKEGMSNENRNAFWSYFVNEDTGNPGTGYSK